MKKKIGLLALVLAIIIATLSLMSCNPNSDKTKVTEDQFYKIFSNLDNFTAVTTSTYEYAGKTETSKYIAYVTPEVKYQKVLEESETMFGEGWQVAIGDKMYSLCTEYTDTLKEKNIAFVTPAQYVVMAENFGGEDLRTVYRNATYDEEKKAYLYSNVYTYGDLEYTDYCEIYFENGKLVRIVGSNEWDGAKNTYESVYSDIGTTSIENKYKVVLLGMWDRIEKEGHHFVIAAPACTTAEGCEGIGTAVYHCSHCDQTLTYEYIDGHRPMPTIDNGSVSYKCSKCDQPVDGMLVGSRITVE